MLTDADQRVPAHACQERRRHLATQRHHRPLRACCQYLYFLTSNAEQVTYAVSAVRMLSLLTYADVCCLC